MWPWPEGQDGKREPFSFHEGPFFLTCVWGNQAKRLTGLEFSPCRAALASLPPVCELGVAMAGAASRPPEDVVKRETMPRRGVRIWKTGVFYPSRSHPGPCSYCRLRGAETQKYLPNHRREVAVFLRTSRIHVVHTFLQITLFIKIKG